MNFLTKKGLFDLRLVRNLILVILVGELLISCKMRPSVPDGAIDTKTMSKILAEIHVAETKATRLGIVDIDSTRAAYKYFEGQIMAKYKVDTATYRKSYDFYAANPEYFSEVYGEVIKILEKQKGDLEKPEKSSNVKPTK